MAASGFLTDSYSLFATNVILTSLAYVYWPDHATRGWFEMAINISTLSGSILGQIGCGILADKYGRISVYGWELVIVLTATIGVALSAYGISSNPDKLSDSSMSITASLLVFRFFMGVGIGAEYPISAVLTSE